MEKKLRIARHLELLKEANKIRESGVIFFNSSFSNKIIEDVNIDDEQDQILVVLKTRGEAGLYEIAFDGVIIPTIDMIRIIGTGNGSTIQLFDSSEDDCESKFEVYMKSTQFCSLDFLNRMMSEEDTIEIYEITIHDIPVHLLPGTSQIKTDDFPIIYATTNITAVENFVGNVYKSDIFAYMYPSSVIPQLVDTIITPLSQTISYHEGLVTAAKEKARMINTVDLDEGSGIIEIVDDGVHVFTVNSIEGSNVVTEIDLEEDLYGNYPIKYLSETGVKVIAPSTPVYTYDPDVTEEESSSKCIVSKIPYGTYGASLKHNDTVACIVDYILQETLDNKKINDLYTKKLKGKRIDYKRNKTVKSINNSVDMAIRAYNLFMNITSDPDFNIDEIYVINSKTNSVIHLTESILKQDIETYTSIQTLIGADKKS